MPPWQEVLEQDEGRTQALVGWSHTSQHCCSFNMELCSGPLWFPMQNTHSSTGTEVIDPFLYSLNPN